MFDGRYHPATEWFLASLDSLKTFPFERHVRRQAIGVLRASGERILEEIESKERAGSR